VVPPVVLAVGAAVELRPLRSRETLMGRTEPAAALAAQAAPMVALDQLVTPQSLDLGAEAEAEAEAEAC